MGFGRQRAREARPFAPSAVRRAALFVTVSILVLLVVTLSSCGRAFDKGAISSSLRILDTLIASRDIAKLDRAFSLSYRTSREASDWLSILKRAKAAEAAGDSGRYAGAADRARKAFPTSEPIAAASAVAYLRGGRPADALVLFGGPISPDARPSLWAEAFLATPAASAHESAKSEDYARLADITGSPRPLLGAAALALAAGDRLEASAWLRKAMIGGIDPPPELLWDSGLYHELAARAEIGASAYELALMGDAAWMSGDPSLAKRRLERSIALEPKLSWKPYVDLALSSGVASEAADSYWSRLKAAFLAGPAGPERDGALAAYAAELARKGRDTEALRALAGGEGSSGIAVLSLDIESRSMPEGKLAARFERLAAGWPDDADVQGAVLRVLALRGMYGELAVVREVSARKRLPIAYGWYYDAVLSAARGDYKTAAATIASAGQLGSAPAGSYALGSLYGVTGDDAQSADAFARAADSARAGSERCACFKALGRALGASGDLAGAARAYRSAQDADPSDPEAAILARMSK